MEKSKWFYFEGKSFSSKKRSGSLREAFQKTIEKWNLTIAGYKILDGEEIETCGLCDLFWEEDRNITCQRCPIYHLSHIMYCQGTPFRIWEQNRSRKNAILELEFLKFVKKQFLK